MIFEVPALVVCVVLALELSQGVLRVIATSGWEVGSAPSYFFLSSDRFAFFECIGFPVLLDEGVDGYRPVHGEVDGGADGEDQEDGFHGFGAFPARAERV